MIPGSELNHWHVRVIPPMTSRKPVFIGQPYYQRAEIDYVAQLAITQQHADCVVQVVACTTPRFKWCRR